MLQGADFKGLQQIRRHCTATGPTYDGWGLGWGNAMLSDTGCRQKGMSSPKEVAERPALRYSTKTMGTNLEQFWQGKPERKDSLTHAGLHLV